MEKRSTSAFYFLRVFGACAVFLFLYLPIIVLVVFSFNEGRTGGVWTGWSIKWYGTLFGDRDLLFALGNSLYVATLATLIATPIGTLAALGLERGTFPGRRALARLLVLPMVMPDIVFAIALLSFFVLIRFTLGIYSIVLAHVTFDIAFVAMIVRARLARMDSRLELAAHDLGASPWQAFIHVTVPSLAPGVLAGALLAFTLSWDDFVITFFVAGVGGTTFPLKIYSMVKFGVSPEINAACTIMLVLSVLLLLLARQVERNVLTATHEKP